MMLRREAVQAVVLGSILGARAGSADADTTVNVSTAAQLQNAVAAVNSTSGNETIILADGTYTLTGTLYVNVPSITITSRSGVRENVLIEGDAMSATAKVQNLIRVAARNFTISNLTLQKSGLHLLQIAGESKADHALVHNVVFKDAYQQMLKVSVDRKNLAVSGDDGIVEDSLFVYTAGIGPEYYIGGIDIHAGKNWIVRRNTFRSIISPERTVAEFAIHVWNTSANALIEKNRIINCDRGIGFGLDTRGNTGGIIRNNMIYHDADQGQFADVSIDLETSPGTQVYNNTILTRHSYPRSIEYRWTATAGVLVVNNLANKPVAARDGAVGTVESNVENALASWFVNPSQGDLHLSSAIPAAVDAGRAVRGLTDDFDGTSRPQGSGIDIGAHEWRPGVQAQSSD